MLITDFGRFDGFEDRGEGGGVNVADARDAFPLRAVVLLMRPPVVARRCSAGRRI
jgi:hypothetical protein